MSQWNILILTLNFRYYKHKYIWMILFLSWKEMEALKTLVFFSNFIVTSSKFWGEQLMSTISIRSLWNESIRQEKAAVPQVSNNLNSGNFNFQNQRDLFFLIKLDEIELGELVLNAWTKSKTKRSLPNNSIKLGQHTCISCSSIN